MVGVLRNGDGPTVAFRADTDGLPLAEDTGVNYASTATGRLEDGTEVTVGAPVRPLVMDDMSSDMESDMDDDVTETTEG